MATYNKRGYKTPKEKEEKDSSYIEDVKVDEKDSTTAGVFNSLDETASKTEDWVARNQKYIFGVVAAIAVVTVGYLMYQKFIVQPKEDEAATEIYEAQQNFQKAVDATTNADSLFNLCLKGAKGSLGFVEIADKFSGTSAGNLANYYAGISYLNTGKYAEAITSLENFKSNDMILSVLAVGAIGDAYAQKKQPNEALAQYIKASEMNKNDLTTPRFLLKAGQIALVNGKKAEAFKYFTEIKEKYESTPEGSSVDALIGLAQ
jgi:tetratricopeptide (TPR) repeat protein